jgi:hypothetical protein
MATDVKEETREEEPSYEDHARLGEALRAAALDED